MIARPIACSERIDVYAKIDGDSRTHTAYALFSIASIIDVSSETKSLRGAAQARGHRGALVYGLFLTRVRSELQEDQHDGGDTRAERHQDRDGGHTPTRLEQEPRHGRREHRAAAPDADREPRAGGTYVRRERMREDRIETDDTGVREEAREEADQAELAEIGRRLTEDADQHCRQREHADREALQAEAYRQEAEHGAAGGAARHVPREHSAGRARGEAHPNHDVRHPLQDVIERRDVEEIGGRADQRRGDEPAAEDVHHRALARLLGNVWQRRNGGLADLAHRAIDLVEGTCGLLAREPMNGFGHQEIDDRN